VENRIKIGISCNSTNCLRRHIWYVKQVTIERQMPSLLMENGEVDSYNNVLFYTANDEQMDQRTLSALSYLSRGYDMVQVYIRCLTTMTKSYGLLSQVGIQYTKHLGEYICL
jgi:hypothetical protein